MVYIQQYQQQKATATMSAFDNSQISEEGQEDTSRSELQELNQLRAMLPEPINRLDQYRIRQPTQMTQSYDVSIDEEESQMIMKIVEQTKTILGLEEKIYYYRSECLRLIDQNQQIKEKLKQIQETWRHKQNLFLQTQKKLEDEYLKVSHLQKQSKAQQQKVQELSKLLKKNTQKVDKQISFRNTYNQEMLSKQLLLQQKIIVDLTNKNQKMVKINYFLQNELRIAEEKLINFEMDVQQKICSILVDNVSRLKESQSNSIKVTRHSSTIKTLELQKS